MQLRDAQAELTERNFFDLTHFTFKQATAMWSAVMQMQREAYTAYQSRHAQQLQQEQSEFTQSQQISSNETRTTAKSIQLLDKIPTCLAFN